jgi:mannose-6-phosphate isomerase-like protein (cupin superfamily)
MQMRDRDVALGPRELFVVPRGVEHCPPADAETAVLLFEPGVSSTPVAETTGECSAQRLH